MRNKIVYLSKLGLFTNIISICMLLIVKLKQTDYGLFVKIPFNLILAVIMFILIRIVFTMLYDYVNNGISNKEKYYETVDILVIWAFVVNITNIIFLWFFL